MSESRRNYYRNYRKNNPEKIKAINDRYWAKKDRELIENAKRGNDND